MNKTKRYSVYYLAVTVAVIAFFMGLFYGTSASASGKIIVEPRYGLNTKTYSLGNLGLQINEQVLGNFVVYDGYFGSGMNDYVDRSSLTWFVVRQGMNVNLGKLSIGAGFGVGYVTPDENFNNYLYSKLSYSLW